MLAAETLRPRAPAIVANIWMTILNTCPERISVRLVFVNVERHGFRTKQLWLATTLLDPRLYPAEQLAALCLRRWSLEICFRDIKTTMCMERLRCLTPDMARKELLAFLTAHNLVRLLAAKAARQHGEDPSRISFNGSVDALCVSLAFGASAPAEGHVRPLEVLLELIAEDIVPLRPGRTEPRAVKQRPKNYQLLTSPRRQFKEIPHRTSYKRKTPNALS